MNKARIYDAALALWGHDAQVLKTAEACNALAAACARFIHHKANGNSVAAAAAEVEIMLEQLRHHGLDAMLEQQKARQLARLAQRVGAPAEPAPPSGPQVRTLLADAQADLHKATALYGDPQTNNRQAAAQVRRAIGLLMHAAQKMIAEQQRAEAQR